MVAVILKAGKTMDKSPSSWIMGLDWLKIKGCNSMSDAKLLDKTQNAQCGGPTCTYLGKEIKCYVNSSPKKSITSAMLADMLPRTDCAGVLTREQDGPKPSFFSMGITAIVRYTSWITYMNVCMTGLFIYWCAI